MGRLDDIVQDATDAGLVKMVTASIVPSQWPVSKALAERYVSVEFAWGIHPWYIAPEYEKDLEGLYTARENGAVAIGEIGLDRKKEVVPFDLQRVFFERQLQIARDIDLPVVIHCRGAFDDLIHAVRRIGLCERGGVVHNYSGNADQARQLAEYGLSVSLGATLTYRNSRKKRDVLAAVYPQSFLLETDSPDIPPVEAKERPNVPANIVYNLRAASEVLDESEECIAERTTENAARMFGWAL